MTSNKSRQCRSSPRKRGHFFCHRDARTATDIAPGDADGISPRGCGCGRRNGAPGHPRPHGGETHGQGAPGSRTIAQAATNEPRMDWAPILQGNGHKVNPGTHRGHGVQPSSQPSKPPTDTTKTEPKLNAQISVQQSSQQSKPAKLNHGSTARFWVFLPSIHIVTHT